MRKDTLITILILVGLVVGAIVGQLLHLGLADGESISSIWMDLGNIILIRPLKLLIMPLVFLSVIVGVTSIGDPSRLGVIGGSTVLYYLVTMLLAVILGTALVDTNARSDEVIFEEFKGTGNAELHLDRKLVEKRVWPAINIPASGTRREELLLDPKEHELIVRLRKVVADMNVVEAMELLQSRLSKSKSNGDFLMTMNMG